MTLYGLRIFLNLLKIKVYFFEVNIQYLENVHDFHNGLSFLPERMKIKKEEKLASNLHNK